MHILRALRGLLDVIFPITCINCDRAGAWLCERCFEATPLDGDQRCPVCLVVGARHRACLHPIERLIIVGPYADSPIASAIQGLKFSYIEALAKPLGLLLARSLAPHLSRIPRSPILVPIPLHQRRERERGFNQSERIAHYAAKVLDLPVIDTLIDRQRQTAQQSKLDRQSRRTNLRGAFIVPQGTVIADHTCILVDDVFTSGATLTAAAYALERAGVKHIWSAVVASDASLYRNR